MTHESTIIEVRTDAVAEIRKGQSWYPGPSWFQMYPDKDQLSGDKYQRRVPVPERVECPFTSTR